MKNDELISKCIKVIWTCENLEQFKGAVRFCNLAAESKEVQSDSFRLANFILPIERAFAVKVYLLKNN